jgi:hypothetical protein
MHQQFHSVSIPYKNDLSHRVKQDLYIKQLDGVKIHQQFHPVSIPYKNDLSHRVKQDLYIKQ